MELILERWCSLVGRPPRDRTDLVSVSVGRSMILLVPRTEGSALKKSVIFYVVSGLAGG